MPTFWDGLVRACARAEVFVRNGFRRHRRPAPVARNRSEIPFPERPMKLPRTARNAGGNAHDRRKARRRAERLAR
jgi:hypothetical protein